MEERVGGTFSFRRRWAQIDWRSLAGLDIDKIAQTVDVQTLQANILNVTFCNVTSEEFHNVDANFIKLFRLSQFIIEYLLYSQQYLTEQIQLLQDQVKTAQEELAVARSKATSGHNALKDLKKENRKRRKMIESYQQMLKAGATGVYPCHVCHREFISAEFLKGHIHRRHPQLVSVKNTSTNNNNIKFSPEELEAKLLQKVNVQLTEAQSQLQQELALKETQLLERKMEELEEWKKREIEQLKTELYTYNQSVKVQLHQQHEQNTEVLKQTLEEAQAELKTLQDRQHKIGAKVEGSTKDFSLTQSDMVELKEQIQSQLNEIQKCLQEQNKDWKKKLKETTKNYELQLQQSHNRLETLEQSFVQVQQRTQSTQKDLPKQTKEEIELTISHPVSTEQMQDEKKLLANVEAFSSSSTSSESSDVEEIDKSKQFTPFAKHPIITSQFDHNPEQLLQLRNTMESIVDEELNKKGVHAINGLNQLQLMEKLTSLTSERDSRIKICPTFTSLRVKVENDLNEDVKKHYVPHTTVQVAKKPPIPSNKPLNLTSPAHINYSIESTTVTKPTAVATPPISPIRIQSNEVVVDSTGTDSITDLSEDSESINAVTPFSTKSPAVHPTENDNNSSSDSIEELLTTRLTSVKTSSTPVKVAELGLDPAKRPPGGVPVMIASQPIPQLENEDSDSFTLSEVTVPPSSPPKKSNEVQIQSIPLMTNQAKQESHVTNVLSSRSVLTSVTDDFDSDLSDIQLT